MLKLLMGFIFLVSFSAQALENPCPYYLKKSQELGCSKENYLTKYGYRYCEAYVKRDSLFTPAGQESMKGIRQCLVDALQQQRNLSCDNVGAFAANTHVQCYLENNFCSLPSRDQILVLWVARGQVFSGDFMTSMEQILKACTL